MNHVAKFTVAEEVVQNISLFWKRHQKNYTLTALNCTLLPDLYSSGNKCQVGR